MTRSSAGALRPDGTLCGVRFERLYKATAEELWSALTRPEQLARWLTPRHPGSHGRRAGALRLRR